MEQSEVYHHLMGAANTAIYVFCLCVHGQEYVIKLINHVKSSVWIKPFQGTTQ